MPAALPIHRVVLYKHGVGYFKRKGQVNGSEALHLDFKARDMNDVLKSTTVLDLLGGTVSAVSYDSMTPLEQLLKEATICILETGSLTALGDEAWVDVEEVVTEEAAAPVIPQEALGGPARELKQGTNHGEAVRPAV